MDITKTLIDYNEQEKTYKDKENQNEIGNSGFMQIKITAKNTGSKDAYQTSYKFVFSKYVTLLEDLGDLLSKKNIITIMKDESSNETILLFNSKRQIPQNTKDTYNVYLKFDFGEEETTTTIFVNSRNLDDSNEKVILKSADVTLCQNVECNDEDSFVNQVININFKINRNIFPDTIGGEEKDSNSEIEAKESSEGGKEGKEEKEDEKNNSWIAAPIIVCVVVVSILIFLFVDYKKKLLFFKKKLDSIPVTESNDKNLEPKAYTIKNSNLVE